MILCYCIMVYGVSNIVVFGSGPFRVFEWLRYWTNEIDEHLGQLFSCMMCFPTNLGIALSLINWFLIPVAFTPFNIMFGSVTGLWWLAAIFDGAFTSGVVWLIHHIQEYLENTVGNGD